ncbi:MAG: hypothetical protein AB7I08_02250 [Thermoleophilia bacterium]
MSKSDEVYQRVKELQAQNPEKSRPKVFEMVQAESGMNVAAVSANFYRAQRSDPSSSTSRVGKDAPATAAASKPAAAKASASKTPALKASKAKASRSSRKDAARKPAASAAPARRSSWTRAASAAPVDEALRTLSGLVDENTQLKARVSELEATLERVRGAVN